MAGNANFCTLNHQDPTAYQPLKSGNLQIGHNGAGADAAGVSGTFFMNSGKWYWEVHQVAVHGTDYPYLGIGQGSQYSSLNDSNRGYNYGPVYNAKNGSLNSQASGYGGLGTLTTTSTGVTAASAGDIVNFALDLDNRKLWIGLNGTYFNSGNPATGTNAQFAWTEVGYVSPYITTYSTNRRSHFNFGQDSTFGGTKSTGTENAADGNGYGNFYDTPPSGFLSICSANIPIDTDIDPSETDNDVPTKQFGVVTITGNATARTISGLGFQPDFIWAHRRDGGQRNYLVDSNRGFTKYLHSEDTYSEGTSSDGITAATSDGFDIGGTGNLDYINANTATYVAWCWRANGGTTSTNTSGTITTTVQANQAAGFSIVTYAGDNGSWGSTHQDTIGHGLSAAPEFMIFKERNATDAWTVFHHMTGNGGGTTPAHNNLRLDTSDALYTNQSYKSFGGVMPTSTVVTIEGNTTNESTSTHVAYIWHSVKGYSMFGRFEGNASTAARGGPFVYCGFRPKMVFVKCVDSGSTEWVIHDSGRNPHNPTEDSVDWDNENQEYDRDGIDFLANGFKITANVGSLNANSSHVFGAWADVPFKYNNAK